MPVRVPCRCWEARLSRETKASLQPILTSLPHQVRTTQQPSHDHDRSRGCRFYGDGRGCSLACAPSRPSPPPHLNPSCPPHARTLPRPFPRLTRPRPPPACAFMRGPSSAFEFARGPSIYCDHLSRSPTVLGSSPSAPPFLGSASAPPPVQPHPLHPGVVHGATHHTLRVQPSTLNPARATLLLAGP